MQSKNDVNILDLEGKKPIASTIARRPLTWYDAEKHAFIPIEPDIIYKLRLTRDDLFTQEVQGENILLRRFKE
ncbi:MAG: hypothetical protein ACRD8W_03380 [Nitrososphaeraceae archaeon]